MTHRCEAITASGNQCKLTAAEGSLFCRVHADRAKQEVQESPAPPVEQAKESAEEVKSTKHQEGFGDLKPRLGGEMPAVHNSNDTKKRKVRYIGRGVYIIAALEIRLGPEDYGTVIEVDRAFWERMHEDAEAMRCFEEV